LPAINTVSGNAAVTAAVASTPLSEVIKVFVHILAHHEHPFWNIVNIHSGLS
jgi:hypothetical protein